MKAAKNKRDKLEKYLTTPNGRKYLNPEWNKYDIQHYLLSKWNWLLMKSDEYKSKDNKKKRRKKASTLTMRSCLSWILTEQRR